MTAVVLPHAELVVREVLIAAPQVAALTLHSIATKDPPLTTGKRWIRLTRTGGIAPVWQGLDAARIDVNCYAPDDIAASLIARTVKAVLLAASQIVVAAGVLAGCDEAVGIQDLTDGSRVPPVARQTFSVNAYIK